MTERVQSISDDAGLKQVLGVLVPPAPSDLLRARVEKAITHAPVQGATARAGATGRASRYSRIAACMLLMAGVAAAIWLPTAPRQLAPVLAGGNGTTSIPVGDNGETGVIALTLVGGGAPVSALPLVHADWTNIRAGTEYDPDFDGNPASDLESIPLY